MRGKFMSDSKPVRPVTPEWGQASSPSALRCGPGSQEAAAERVERVEKVHAAMGMRELAMLCGKGFNL
jgi:hypothetical protein